MLVRGLYSCEPHRGSLAELLGPTSFCNILGGRQTMYRTMSVEAKLFTFRDPLAILFSHF